MKQGTSNRITLIRIILTVFVVFTHNNGFDIEYVQMSYGVKMLFGEMISRTAVPLFFFIAGYFLFLKDEAYGTILKKKTKTLLIPYLLWNGIVLGMLLVGQCIPFTAQFLHGNGNLIRDYSWYQWLDAFLGLNYHGYPIAYQFWFIRDLMILNILYPVWKWLLKRFPMVTYAVVTILWILQLRFVFINSEAVLFFLIGGYVAWRDFDYLALDRMRTTDIMTAYLLCVAVESGLMISEKPFVIVHKIGIILGCLFWLRTSKTMVANGKQYSRLVPFAGYTFFVYAFHEPLLTVIRKIGCLFWVDKGTLVQTVWYFGSIFLTILISIVTGWCISRISPRLYRWLTGGRTAVPPESRGIKI